MFGYGCLKVLGVLKSWDGMLSFLLEGEGLCLPFGNKLAYFMLKLNLSKTQVVYLQYHVTGCSAYDKSLLV